MRTRRHACIAEWGNDSARVLAALPTHPCLPRLLDVYDDGDLVALLVEDLPGAPPPALAPRGSSAGR
ncbi:hypothetical protein LQK93_00124 [Terrabacter sp. BE26]